MKIKNIGSTHILVYPYGFFEGAAADKMGGAGFILAISSVHTFNIKLGWGHNTNTREELLALLALLLFSQDMGLPSLHIFGDSSVIINWANNKASLSSMELDHWCENIRHMIDSFLCLDIRHVYREHNERANGLSKDSLALAPGQCSFSEVYDDIIIESGDFQHF